MAVFTFLSQDSLAVPSFYLCNLVNLVPASHYLLLIQWDWARQMWPQIQVWFHKPYMANVFGLLVGVCSNDRERGVPVQHEHILTNHSIERYILSCLWELSTAWLYNSPPLCQHRDPSCCSYQMTDINWHFIIFMGRTLDTINNTASFRRKTLPRSLHLGDICKGLQQSLPICGHTLACAFEAWLSESS